jgi:UDP-N-acetylmuramoyl-L-alanyl-D-glutamate--2,6-diaminopimelate ligase
VPGRLELIGTTATGGTVFVDYAHKPAALENVLETLRPHVAAHTGANLHVIFGCGGNRDKGKRPLMGGIAQRLADRVIVTDDNPRREDPEAIIADILAGTGTGGAVEVVRDRAAAITRTLRAADPDDIVLIAGKGHESVQTFGEESRPFSDQAVVRAWLDQMA